MSGYAEKFNKERGEGFAETFNKESKREGGFVEKFNKERGEGFAETFRKDRIRRDINLLTEGKGKEPLEAARKLMKELKGKNPELEKELKLFAEKAKQKAIIGEIEYNKLRISRMPEKKAAKYDGFWKGYNEGSEIALKRIIEIEKQRKLSDEELQKKLREALL